MCNDKQFIIFENGEKLLIEFFSMSFKILSQFYTILFYTNSDLIKTKSYRFRNCSFFDTNVTINVKLALFFYS